MLKQVRGALKGVVAWIFVILLIAAFSLFGVPSMSQFLTASAVKVGGEEFSSQFVSNEFNRIFQRQQRESSGSLTRENAVANGLGDQVIDAIATQSVLIQFARKMNLAVPRATVGEFLRENESFQNPATGEFDRATLDALLQNNNMSIEEFERRIKEDITRTQLIDALAASGPAPAKVTDAILMRETERRRIAYLTVTNEMSGMAAEPGPDDLQAYYDANQSTFTAPEYRTIDLLVLRNADYGEQLEAPEDELRRLYEAGRERLYEKPERRTIYQLTYETEAEARAANASLEQGQPFETLAQERGTSLEAATFTDAQKRDILDPAVADAAFADGLGEGALLEPVRSAFGWTIVQIAGVTAAEVQSFEDVRDEIEASYLENDIRRQIQNALDEIEEVRDTGADLSEAAESAGLSVETFGPVDRVSFAPGGAIIDKIPGEALAEAFDLDEGEQSEVLRLTTENGYFVVQLKEVTPPTLKPFDYVRDEVVERWRAKERRDRISQTVQSIRDVIAGGQTLESAAEQFERAPIELVIDRRFQNETISAALNDDIFHADVSDLVASSVGSAGAQVIAEVREVGFARNSISPAEEERLRELVGYQIDQELVEAFVQTVRDDYGVTINQSQIDAIFSDNL